MEPSLRDQHHFRTFITVLPLLLRAPPLTEDTDLQLGLDNPMSIQGFNLPLGILHIL
jgi:hypothetical protein